MSLNTDHVVELNLRTGEKNIIDADKLAQNAIKDKIKQAYGRVGLEISVDSISDPERFVDSYYRTQGYFVEKLDPLGNKSVENRRPIEKGLQDLYNFDLQVSKLLKGGVPDFVVYDSDKFGEVTELFFVEAKNGKDGLSPNQIEWIFHEHINLPVKVCYTHPNKNLVNE